VVPILLYWIGVLDSGQTEVRISDSRNDIPESRW